MSCQPVAAARPDRAPPCAGPSTVEAPIPGRVTRAAASLVLLATIVMASLDAMQAVGTDPGRPGIVDFHAFHLVGRMVWDGGFVRSYDTRLLRELEHAMSGGQSGFLPFVYPPLYGLVMAPLALLPVGPAFLLFVAGTSAFYLGVLRWLAGPWFWSCVLATGPVVLIDVCMGQNGLLTAGLAGLAAGLTLRRRSGWAGLAAGALAFKPQSATMLPLLFLLRRDWRAAAGAAGSAVLLTGLSVAVLGRDTVPGFLAGTAFVADFMAAGSFPFHRMTSIYACALSLGAPARLALALHGAVALLVLAAAAATAYRLGRDPSPAAAPEPGAAAGVMLMATAFVSPYFFDYDLPVVGMGLALALPGLARRLPPRRLAGLLVGVGIAGSVGFGAILLMAIEPRARFSLGGPVLLACFGVMLAALRRQARPQPGTKSRDAAAAARSSATEISAA